MVLLSKFYIDGSFTGKLQEIGDENEIQINPNELNISIPTLNKLNI